MSVAASGILEGRRVRLEPLAFEHAHDLSAIAFDAELWRFTPTQIHGPGDLQTYIDAAQRDQRAGTALPFATVDRATGQAVGCTRFGNIDAGHRRAEIGWTWLGRAFQRKVYNTEAKLLMLRYAFEAAGWVRVELRADALNERSRAAIQRLGATEEGTLRQHMEMPDGRRIDWVYYSILRDEWPGVRDALEAKLARHEND